MSISERFKSYGPWTRGYVIYVVAFCLCAMLLCCGGALPFVLIAINPDSAELAGYGVVGMFALGTPMLALGIVGLVALGVLLHRKKRLGQFSWLIAAAVILALPFLLGFSHIITLIAWPLVLRMKDRRNCPSCQQLIEGDATRCPYCTTEVEPIEPIT